jgi:hypothetical protein
VKVSNRAESPSRTARFDTIAWGAALAILFFLAHVAFLPPTLEDLDSMNFALGILDFDPSKHQPHPPGYPVFIALGKFAHALSLSEVTALAIWGAVFGGLAVFALMSVFGSIEMLDRTAADAIRVQRAMLATLVVVASPLFWFTALRPLSDVPGLTFALFAQACLATAFARQRSNGADALLSSGRLIVLGALLAGLAVGVRTQTVWLTVPLLGFVLIDRAGRGAAGAILGSSMTFSIGVLLWAVPLVIASGGLAKYRAAFAVQTAEQFHGLDILLSNPTQRRLALGIVAAIVGPWAFNALGWIVVVAALIGFAALVKRAPVGAALLTALVAPYALFHIVVQEMHSRYALPLVPAFGYLAVRGFSTLGRKIAFWGSGAIAVTSLLLTFPAVRAYAGQPSPVFAAMEDLRKLLSSDLSGAIGMHQRFARAVETQNFGATRILNAPPMREARELAAYWHGGHHSPVWYLADPARTDLELVDPSSRTLHGHYVWTFPRDRFMSGVRPDVVDLVRIESPPGWFAEEGWHLTSETLNMSERLGRSEGIAYVRNRPGPALLVIGGESTSPPGGEASPVSLSINARTIDRWDVPASGSFFRRFILAPGTFSSESSFSRLVVSYATREGRPETIRLTQFAVASPDDLFFIQHAGWNEIEYSDQLQRRWRWTTGRATTFVNSGGRDVTVTVSGESPLRYFDSAPNVTVRAGDQLLATATPQSDFELHVKIPATALAAADGMITIETDKTFVPSERSGSLDKRTLGLRIFVFDVKPA